MTSIDVYLDLGKKSDKLEEKKDKEQHAYAYMQFKKDGQSERERIDLEGRIDMFADFLYRDRTFACLVENAPKK